MNKLYVLHDKFTKDTLLDFTNYMNKTSPSEKIDIHLSSGGGDLHVLTSFLHIVNEEPERFRIITSGLVGSAAFDFLLYARCEKIIGKLTRGMTHLSAINIQVCSSGVASYHEGDYFKKENKIRYKTELAEFKKMHPNLTPTILKNYIQGAEIYFTEEEIKKIIKLNWNYEEA